MSHHFYQNLKPNFTPLQTLLKRESSFEEVPNSWFIVVTDIENSTQAVAQNFHSDVNLAATGCIVSVLNKVKETDDVTVVPYFYGGDGVTFLVPPKLIDVVFEVVDNYKVHVLKQFKLNLRVGKVSVKDIYESGFQIKITKLQQNKLLAIPIVLGNGLKEAEAVVKSQYELNYHDISPKPVNLKGMECRWDEIRPIEEKLKVFCLIVLCNNENEQAMVYSGIISKIDKIFGNLDKRRPINAINLKLKPTLKKIKSEMNIKLGKFNFGYLLQNWLLTSIGVYYFKFFPKGKKYLFSVSQLSDTIMIDGSLTTVLSGTQKQMDLLRGNLEQLECSNKILYGIHTTYASIMSCYVENMDKNHIHFVDGTEGGYTSAATILKEKIKASKAS
ncbi:DUF3095 family protein [Winogradskyella jejuensis]|uniref:DUF3095 domain-containing protein n=1 Tax=Winogradskyella jejuensis TaxID=1089305 RepID=A0A1M5TU61_9FLAO|nr:DUF3095 family protein [Winogradskyella jejuensis]SHH54170.1 Protein of unknown function [Winogradskyella jejuensis]